MYKAIGNRLAREIDLIVASGDDRIGALVFGPTPRAPNAMSRWGRAE